MRNLSWLVATTLFGISTLSLQQRPNPLPPNQRGGQIAVPRPGPQNPPQNPPPSSGSAQNVLQASDITYLGAIRMPTRGVDTSFAYGGLTGRIVNGRLHFFLYGNTTGTPKDAVYEIEDPGSGYNKDYTQAPHATLVTNWGDVYQGKRVSWDDQGNMFAPQNLIPDGIYWNDNTQLLYWTYHDSYNVTHRPDWDLGATALNDPFTATSTAYGPWRPVARDADGNTFYGPWRCLYLFANPSDGTMMCGSGPMSGNSGSPWGPDAFGGQPWPTNTTPAGYGRLDLNLQSRYLEYYFMGNTNSPNYIDQAGKVHGQQRAFRRTNDLPVWETFIGALPLRANPALNGGIGSWSEMDGASGAVWLELTHKRGVLFSAFLVGSPVQDPSDCVNAAHEWYSNAGLNPPIGACSHGCAPPVGITGPVTTAAFPALIIYNPDQLRAVKNGMIQDYVPDPVAVINLEESYTIHTASITTVGAGKVIRGLYFDPVRKYLFVLAPMADETPGPYAVSALIHVFAISDF